MEQNSKLARELVDFLIVNGTKAAIEAGQSILPLYYSNQQLNATTSSNKTLVTQADQIANQTIKNTLAQTRIPIMSEEGRDMLYEERYSWELYWLVDPLDGTREFIQHVDEFVVSIALMSQNRALFGVIYSPTNDTLYFSDPDRGSFKRENATQMELCTLGITTLISGSKRLKCKESNSEQLKIAVTRSHINKETEHILTKIKAIYNKVEVIHIGSSIKMCMVAEGLIDSYFRTTTLYDWDIAAGEAIAKGAGAVITTLEGDAAIEYNKTELIMRPFVVSNCHEINSTIRKTVVE